MLLFIVTVIVSTLSMEKGTQNSENTLLRSCKPCLPGNPEIFFLFKDVLKIYSVTISYMYIMYLTIFIPLSPSPTFCNLKPT